MYTPTDQLHRGESMNRKVVALIIAALLLLALMPLVNTVLDSVQYRDDRHIDHARTEFRQWLCRLYYGGNK